MSGVTPNNIAEFKAAMSKEQPGTPGYYFNSILWQFMSWLLNMMKRHAVIGVKRVYCTVLHLFVF